MEGKRYFHVCTKGSDLEWMFRDDADFIGGVNRIGICVLATSAGVFAFILMDTHVHFILYGTMPVCKEFIKKYKQLTGRWIFEKYGISGHIADVETNIIHITSEEHLMEEVAYLDRNSISAGYRHLPTQYPWGSARYMFREEYELHGVRFNKASQFCDNQLRQLLSTRVSIPSDWEIDSDGMVNPNCFMDISKVESLFKTPNRYIYFLSKKVEGSVEMRHSQGRKSFIPDKELRLVADELAKEIFGVKNRRLLDVKSRIVLARKLRYEYASTPKQIARLLQVDLEFLNGFI